MSRYIYQGVMQDGNGKRIEGGTVSVLLAGTSTPASIYTAATGGAAVNSVTTASNGGWSFYVDITDYDVTQKFDISMSKSGYLTSSVDDVMVLPSSHITVNVKQFGATGDGVTDDVVAIQAAATYLSTVGGGVLYIPLGTYKLSTYIYFTGDIYSNITVQGEGRGSHLVHNVDSVDNSAGIIIAQGSTAYSMKGLCFRDFRVSGNSANDQIRMIYISNSNGTIFEGLYIDTNSREGIYFTGDDSNTNAKVNNCHAENIGKAEAVSAFNINCSNAIVTNNTAENCGVGLETQSARLTLANNIFKDIDTHGAMILSTWASYDIGAGEVNNDVNIVTGNQFVNCEVDGILVADYVVHLGLKGNSGKVLISGNEFIKCGVAIQGGVDTDVAFAGAIVITGNYFYDTYILGGACIQIQKGTGVITNNTFELGPTTQWTYLFFTPNTNDERHIIKDNIIIGDVADQHYFVTNQMSTISGNILEKVDSLIGTTQPAVSWGGADFRLSEITNFGSADFILSPSYPNYINSPASGDPADGTWKIGSKNDYSDPATGGFMGKVNTVTGTAGTFPAAVTVSTTATSADITFGADPLANGLRVGSYFTIAGVTGTKRLLSIDGTDGVIDSVADATVAGAAGTYVAPVWKTYGVIS